MEAVKRRNPGACLADTTGQERQSTWARTRRVRDTTRHKGLLPHRMRLRMIAMLPTHLAASSNFPQNGRFSPGQPHSRLMGKLLAFHPAERGLGGHGWPTALKSIS